MTEYSRADRSRDADCPVGSVNPDEHTEHYDESFSSLSMDFTQCLSIAFDSCQYGSTADFYNYICALLRTAAAMCILVAAS
jgi:hypothetical protein